MGVKEKKIWTSKEKKELMWGIPIFVAAGLLILASSFISVLPLLHLEGIEMSEAQHVSFSLHLIGIMSAILLVALSLLRGFWIVSKKIELLYNRIEDGTR